MADSESIKKMLRSVLQSSKNGVNISSLQADYKSLCGEAIPLKRLGFSNLEDYLRSIPSVVRLESRQGFLVCFATVCKETAHIAELVARQKNSKKAGRSQVVNCKMRFKPSNPYALSGRLPVYFMDILYFMPYRLSQVLNKYKNGLWMSKLPAVYNNIFNRPPHPRTLLELEKWTHICSVRLQYSFIADCLIYPPLPPPTYRNTNGPDVSPNSPASTPLSSPSASTISENVRQKVKELLFKYSSGLWVQAVPKIFEDTYKMPLPEHALDDLSLWLDICSVEYPFPNDKKKAILYYSGRGDSKTTEEQAHPLPSGLEVVGATAPPRLAFPSEQYPSVLVTDAKASPQNAFLLRYVGKNYSNAQEAMEEAMCSFYSKRLTGYSLSKVTIGQLVAAREDEDVARAQVMEVINPQKVKVSLEHFSSHPSVLSILEKLAIGKILLMETLEPCQHNDTPLVVLYDTSEAEDLNINSACLKVLQDETMNNPLTINVTYQDVSVTNVCADGIIYCQLPSRGMARLMKLLEQTEAFFKTQVTSESLVSSPFTGKLCLARYKGKWSRVEVANIYGNRVLETLFIDFGVTVTIEVTELREIPPLLLKDFIIIPPQAIRCRLEDVQVPEGGWSPEAVKWVKKVVLGAEAAKMTVRWCIPVIMGQNMDVFVPVACHPGYFVLQPWQDLHKLVVLMGEMVLYYNKTSKTSSQTEIKKAEVYAAKIDKNWHRVLVKGILSNGLISIYELDHGKHELVRSTAVQPLIEQFRQLPFQAITAQLAGLSRLQWSEEASIVFRNHVEKRALVAQVDSVQEAPDVRAAPWERRLTVYLVDTTMEDRDLWIHTVMADIGGELTMAA
uniref:Tudor domain containing 7 n=1 Tax=Periophthalmus magnuspinnatus TaxID=409849 RepID=A0A3B3ZE17_9GOBI